MKKSNKLLIYKIALAIFAILLVVIPTSNNKAPEIDLRVLVAVMGIDKEEEGLRVSAEILMPAKSMGGAPEASVISSKGKNISQAFANLSVSMGRKVELGHCGLVIFGEKTVETDIGADLKFMVSSGMLSGGVSLLVAAKMTAHEFISQAQNINEQSAEGLNNLISYSNKGAHVPTVTLLRFLSLSQSESGNSFMPYVVIGEKTKPGSTSSSDGSGVGSESEDSFGGEESNGESGSSSGGENSQNGESRGSEKGGESSGQPTSTEIKSIDSVVLFHDYKKAEILKQEHVKSLVWMDTQSDKGLIVLDNFIYKGKNFGKISAVLRAKNSGIKPSFKNGLPTAELSLHAYMRLLDPEPITHASILYGIDEKQLYDALRDAYSKQFIEELQKGADYSRQLGIDFLMIKNEFHKFKFKEYKRYNQQWQDNFLKDIKITYKVNCTL